MVHDSTNIIFEITTQVCGSSTGKYFRSLKYPLFSSLSNVTFCGNPNPALICGNKTIAVLLIVYNSTDGSRLTPQTSMMMEITVTKIEKV